MKQFLAYFAVALIATSIQAAIPQQSQASTLAVPGEAAQKPYASALVVVRCKQVVAAILVDANGFQHPLNLKELTPAMLLTQLSQAPAENVTQIEVACPSTSI